MRATMRDARRTYEFATNVELRKQFPTWEAYAQSIGATDDKPHAATPPTPVARAPAPRVKPKPRMRPPIPTPRPTPKPTEVQPVNMEQLENEILSAGLDDTGVEQRVTAEWERNQDMREEFAGDRRVAVSYFTNLNRGRFRRLGGTTRGR